MIDTHAHYAHKRFDFGRDEILRKLADSGVTAVIEGAIDFASNQKMKSLCDKYSHVFMAAGCHPNCVEEMTPGKYEEIAALMKCSKVVAVGETGLDYARDKSTGQISVQKEWFRKFVELAIEVQKPLVIHCREAFEDSYDILREYELPERPGVIHCFNGNLEQARKWIDMGFVLGVNGMFTKMEEAADLRKALECVPLEKLLLETDAPFLIPEGIAGKRNTSKNLAVIVEKLAELRGDTPEHIREVVLKNTGELYPTVIEGR